MKKILVLSLLALSLLAAQATTLRYWDANGTADGAGSAPTGTWGVDAYWSTNSYGTNLTAAWEPGMVAVFSAGTNATGTFTVSVNGTQTAGFISVEEGDITLSGGTLILTNAGGSINVSTGATTTVTSVIASSTGLTKENSGTLVIGATNSYVGATKVVNGTLRLSASEVIPDASAMTVTNDPGPATFDLNGFNETVGSLAGGSTNAFVALGSGQLTVGGDNTSTTYSGRFSGAGRITKTGNGTWKLTGTSTNTGGITINGGVLEINLETSSTAGAANALGAAPAAATPNSLVISNGATLRNNRVGAGNAFVIANRGITIGPGGAVFEVTDATPGDELTYNGILAGTGSFTKAGPGVLQLQNTGNSYSGNTTNLGGLAVNATAKLGDGTGTLVLAGGEFISFANRTVGLANPILMTADTTIRSFTNLTSGTQILPFSNNSVAATGGTLTIRNRGLVAGTTFSLRLSGGGFTFSRPIVIGDAGDAGLSRFEHYAAATAGDTTFSGVLSGPGQFVRDAATTGGRTLFTVANTYSGGTTVNAGTLLVNNATGSGTGPGAVTVNAGGTLGGTGTIAGAVAGSGKISPGSSVGTLTLQSGLDLSSGGSFIWELATNSTSPGSFDQIALTGGNLVLGGTSKLSINFIGAAAPPSAGDAFWSTPHTWTVLGLSGGAGNPGSTDVLSLTNAIYTNGYFTTSISSGNVQLNFTPGPPPKPALATPVGAGSTNVTLSFTNLIKGASYQVQSNTNLSTTNWSVLTNVVATSGSLSVAGGAGTDPQRYYRAVLLP